MSLLETHETHLLSGAIAVRGAVQVTKSLSDNVGSAGGGGRDEAQGLALIEGRGTTGRNEAVGPTAVRLGAGGKSLVTRPHVRRLEKIEERFSLARRPHTQVLEIRRPKNCE